MPNPPTAFDENSTVVSLAQEPGRYGHIPGIVVMAGLFLAGTATTIAVIQAPALAVLCGLATVGTAFIFWITLEPPDLIIVPDEGDYFSYQRSGVIKSNRRQLERAKFSCVLLKEHRMEDSVFNSCDRSDLYLCGSKAQDDLLLVASHYHDHVECVAAAVANALHLPIVKNRDQVPRG